MPNKWRNNQQINTISYIVECYSVAKYYQIIILLTLVTKRPKMSIFST